MWKRLNLVVCIILVFVLNAKESFGARLYQEKEYQEYWCNKYSGNAEVQLFDGTRVDCVLNDYAIEFDFANKWAEAIGQSLYYGIILNKKSGIVLILENREKDEKYLKRLLTVTNLHGIRVWIMTPSDLNCNIN